MHDDEHDGEVIEAPSYLDEVPVDFEVNDIIPFPASDPSGENVQLRSRVPASWLVTIDRIREAPGTNLPAGLWQTRSDFVRWCIFLGIRQFAQLQAAIDTTAPEDSRPTLIAATSFVEKQQGESEATMRTLESARRAAEAIAQGVATCMALGESDEAVLRINKWMHDARELGIRDNAQFFERAFVGLFLAQDGMLDTVRLLMARQQIVDEYIEQAVEHYINATQGDPTE